MGTYRKPEKHQCLNKPRDYTAIGKKTGGNFGLAMAKLYTRRFKKSPELNTGIHQGTYFDGGIVGAAGPVDPT